MDWIRSSSVIIGMVTSFYWLGRIINVFTAAKRVRLPIFQCFVWCQSRIWVTGACSHHPRFWVYGIIAPLMSFATVFAVRTPANNNSPSAMMTGSTLGSVACTSTAAGGVSCTDVSAAQPLITPAISAIAINFFIFVHPLLMVRHPDKET